MGTSLSSKSTKEINISNESKKPHGWIPRGASKVPINIKKFKNILKRAHNDNTKTKTQASKQSNTERKRRFSI